MVPRLTITAFAIALLFGATVQASASNPSPSPAGNEHPIRARVHPNSLPSDQLKLLPTRTRTAVQTATIAPFLTRPYWGWHAVNSVFDHCMPTGYYVADNKICEVDGTVALKSNGVDPYFNLGYATTPGGTNYLYYDGHNGWDLALNYETLIAAAPGVVTYAGFDSYGWGNTVLIDHGNGFKTRYAHLSQIDVAVNQSVGRGQRIGISGNTGNSTGPHLHFGVYRTDQTLSNGDMVAIDPWGWQAATGTDPWPYDEGNVWLTGNPHDPVPDAPLNVTASSTCSSALVGWSPPAFDGGSGISSYTVKASPGGASQTVNGSTTQTLFTGLTSGTAYTFTVVATGPAGSGPASTASNTLTAPASGAIDDACHIYTLSGRGGVQAAGVAPKLAGSPAFGFDIGRSLALFPDGSGGYELDGYGGMHPVGSAPAIPLPGYWPNWDIARSVALAPWSTASNPVGWTMDGFGGLHTFGGAPALSGAPYWPGWDIAKQLVILPDSTPTSVKGYVLDGFGGLHSLGGAPAIGAHAYWPGKDLARGVALLPGSTATSAGGYTLDAYGGVHQFGNAPAVTGAPNWANWDIARGIVLWNSAPAGSPGGWVLDGWGVLHAFGSAPGLTVGAHTTGADTFRGAAGAGSGNGGDGRAPV